MEVKLPLPVATVVKNGELIFMKATSETEYDKYYLTDISQPINAARKVKHIKLPINEKGNTYETVESYFEFLVQEKGYERKNVIE